MKRILDLSFATAGLIVLSPVFLLVGLAVKTTSPGSILFQQKRMGRFGQSFTIYKFRSMCAQKSGNECQVTAGGDTRITPFGGFLRRTKLDELPQLLNVLRGEMSFVGPRPEVPEFAELFPMEYAHILSVRPGITHPATLAFRREEEILAGADDPREFYIEKLMPEKLAAYEADLEQSLVADIRTIVETILPLMGTKPLTPSHFAPLPVLVPDLVVAENLDLPDWFAPTVVENIPAYAEEAELVNIADYQRAATVSG